MSQRSGFVRPKRHTRMKAKIPVVQFIVAGIVVALTVALVVVTNSGKNTGVLLRQSEESLISSVYASITSLERSYEAMSLPGADVENDILPKMRLNLNAAKTVNKILVDVYGDDRAVLSDDMFTQIDESISYMESVIEMGKSQDDAKTQMGQCMEKVQIAMMQRFPQDTSMMPNTT